MQDRDEPAEAEGSTRSDVGGGDADAVVGGLDEAGGAGVAGQAEGHAVHDVAEADAVLGVGEAHRAAGPGVAEGGRPAVAGDLRRREEAEPEGRSEEHTSELQSLMRISYAVFCLKKKKHKH